MSRSGGTRVAGAVAALATVLALAGCMGNYHPPTSDAAQVSPGAVSTDCGAGDITLPISQVTLATAPSDLNPVDAPDLTTVHEVYRIGAKQASVDRPALARDAAFTDQAKDIVDRALEDFFGVTRSQFPKPATAADASDKAQAELTGTWSLVAAAGSVVGISFTFTRQSPGQESVPFAYRVLYSDSLDDQAWDAKGLFTPAGLAAARACMEQVLRGQGVVTAASLDQDSIRVIFDHTGALFMTGPPELTPGETHLPAVRFAGTAAKSILADPGNKVRTAVETQAPTAPSRTPTPSASAKPSVPPGTASATATPSPSATAKPTAKPPIDPIPVTTPPQPGPAAGGVDCATQKCVALTFDDGPSAHTMELLDILDRYGVKATFFIVGMNVAKHRDALAAEAARGHEVGEHTWGHVNLTEVDDAQLTSEIQHTATEIAGVTGKAPFALRPPYGAYNDHVKAMAGMPLIMWSVDPEDWKYRDTPTVQAHVLSAVAPGSIVLMHDLYESTIQAVPGIIEQLKAQGYTFVTVSQLFAGQNLEAGKTYSHRPSTATP